MADHPSLTPAYFAAMSAALHRAGIAQPTLVIDRERLDFNIDRLKDALPAGMGYRIVAKSLPSIPLIHRVRARTGSDRLMTFNLQMLLQVARDMPDAGQLLGKPMPVAAARRFHAEAPPDADVQWLIDTPERLDQYLALAAELGQHLKIVLELDVGLHRGGFGPDDELLAAAEKIRASNTARLTGLMGYEPHVAKMPVKAGLQQRALDAAWTRFKAAKTLTGLDGAAGGTIFNAGGSPTYRLYTDTSVANELSAGSVLVKPTDFDTPLLDAHRPASFIAAPALKVLDGIDIAGFDLLPGREPDLPEGHTQTVYIFGGNWMAEPVWPEGLALNDRYGRSSNQQMLTAPAGTRIKPDDFVFFRPKQSEAVFLQFGDIAVFEGGRIVETWPVFPASA